MRLKSVHALSLNHHSILPHRWPDLLYFQHLLRSLIDGNLRKAMIGHKQKSDFER
jgi:hypothetical protein